MCSVSVSDILIDIKEMVVSNKQKQLYVCTSLILKHVIKHDYTCFLCMCCIAVCISFFLALNSVLHDPCLWYGWGYL